MKRYINTLLFVSMMLLGSTVFGSTLEKGIYTIQNNTHHDNPVGAGMSRSYTEAASKIEVKDDGMYATIGLNTTSVMGDFVIKVNGSNVSYEVAKQEASREIKELRFKIGSLSDKVTMGLYVIPMDVQVDYEVTFNQSTLQLVEKAAASVENATTDTVAPATQKQEADVSSGTTPVVKQENTVKKEPVSTEEIDAKKEVGKEVKQTTDSAEVDKEVIEEVTQEKFVEEMDKVDTQTAEIAERETETLEQIAEGKEQIAELDATTGASEALHKKALLYTGVGILLLAVAGAGVYYYYRKQKRG